MEKTDMKYDLKKFKQGKSLNGWDRYEFVYHASHPNICNGKESSKIEITLQLCNNTNLNLNGHFTLLWYTIRDSDGVKLQKPSLGWTYSDYFLFPNASKFPENLGEESFKKLMEELLDTAFRQRILVKKPMQNSINGALIPEQLSQGIQPA